MNFIDRIYGEYLLLKAKALVALADDRGDTNFISVVVILAIVVVLAVLFNEQATNAVTALWGKINGRLSGLG